MNTTHDKALQFLAQVWMLDGDLMRCRDCGRGLIASRDGEPLNHRTGCKNEARGNPWHELREIITHEEGGSSNEHRR